MITDDTYEIEYAGDGTVKAYAYDFKIYSEQEVIVTIWDDSGGAGSQLNETVLTLNTHYTVTGVLNDRGGVITLLAPPTTNPPTVFAWLDPDNDLKIGYSIKIENNPSFTQAVSFGNQQTLNRRQIEDAFDKATSLLQQKFRETLRWAGTWSPTTQYSEGDVVTYENPATMHSDHFIAVRPSRDIAPGSAGDHESGQIGNHWDSLVNELLGGPFLPLAGGTVSGDILLPLDLSNSPDRAAISKSFFSAVLDSYLSKAGGEMTGELEIGYPIDNNTGVNAAVSKTWVEALIAAHELTPHGGAGGMGLTQTQVAGIITRDVEAWARVGQNPDVIIPSAKLDEATSGIADWARDPDTEKIPWDKMSTADNPIATWAQDGDTTQIPLNKLGNAPSGGGGNASELEPLPRDPAIVDAMNNVLYTVGDIVNVNGELRILRSGAPSSVLNGVGAFEANQTYEVANIPRINDVQGKITTPGFTGDWKWIDAETRGAIDPTFTGPWYTFRLPVTVVGTQPPQNLYAQMVGANRETADIVFERDAVSDLTDANGNVDYRAYKSTSTSAFELQQGVAFSVSFFSDSSRGTPYNIALATNTWHHLDEGITQSEVNYIINKDLPVARRVPDFDTTEAGKYLRVDNAAPAALEFGDLPNPTKKQVYDQAKGIISPGAGINITTSDATETIGVEERPVPTGNALPAMPVDGDRFDLLADVASVAFDPVSSFQRINDNTDTARGWQMPIAQRVVNHGPHRIVAYSNSWEHQIASVQRELRGKVFVQYYGLLPVNTVAQQPDANKTPSGLVLYGVGVTNPDASPKAIDSRNAPTGNRLTESGFQDHFEVPGISYTDIDTLINTGTTDWHRNLVYTTVPPTREFPNTPKPRGAYIYSETMGWVFAPETPASWARQGRPEPRTLRAVNELMDGPGTGITIAANRIEASNGLLSFTTTPDLDDAEYGHGIFQIEVTFTTGGGTNNQIGFERSSLDNNPARSATIAGFAFASTLRASATVTSGLAPSGVLIGELQMYDGLTATRTLRLYLGKDASNNVGYNIVQVAGGEANRAAVTVSVQVRAAFLHNDVSPLNEFITGLTVENSGTRLGAIDTVDELNFGSNLIAQRGTGPNADKVTINATSATLIAPLAALSNLPTTTSDPVGTLAYVANGTDSIMTFMIVAKTGMVPTWRCIAGSSGYLFNGNVSMHLSAVNGINTHAVGSFAWDARFPYHLIRVRAPLGDSDRVGDYPAWHRVKTTTLLALTASDDSSTGIINQRGVFSNYVTLYSYTLGATVHNTLETSGYMIALGRGTNNAARIGMSSGVVFSAANRLVQIIGTA